MGFSGLGVVAQVKPHLTSTSRSSVPCHPVIYASQMVGTIEMALNNQAVSIGSLRLNPDPAIQKQSQAYLHNTNAPRTIRILLLSVDAVTTGRHLIMV